MTWIKTVRPEADPHLMQAVQEQSKLYPAEYAVPVESLREHQSDGPAIVMAHSLLPDVLKHTFSTFGALMSEELPLKRRHHEMIAATVSALNDCFY